ncbi:hypothetical protein [Actinoalloteichus sp. GBA129-24]|uniref:hypothetical protein n=1 Tax=Actinoalloteichus sp. GBA129-24 TaxID=1612551 RepID=UPI00095055F7|nr:hypothetical protein [Actinoalloteichus sp. GBA129-24]APU20905.1 hypothetical protein UA75_14475 [Actinoalloteichus sp. GBA129-24]APU24154.1 hypothetical protein UA75_30955 [Actinoalloteichus sp. GBA129-24]
MNIYLIRRSMDGPSPDAAYAMVIVARNDAAARRAAVGASQGGAEAVAWMDATTELIGTAASTATDGTAARVILDDATA